ncbi:unnamed protein product [Paramecium pentaurelia]|uniref:Uncharacterized protein n=1 Tax=Paramecium pentaurelia TaxID=43138 RepID=A0A8S1SVA7_9CILI|nr:unnamed protein product [Paramecium pentaurelia]
MKFRNYKVKIESYITRKNIEIIHNQWNSQKKDKREEQKYLIRCQISIKKRENKKLQRKSRRRMKKDERIIIQILDNMISQNKKQQICNVILNQITQQQQSFQLKMRLLLKLFNFKLEQHEYFRKSKIIFKSHILQEQ